jgi:hypothetical protein
MNSGYVPMRRGVIDHFVDGSLTSAEWAVLALLLLLADSGSGQGHVNAPYLLHFFPDLCTNGAKRVLLSLETKGYLYRQIVPHAHRAYEFWIDKYQITTGPRARSRVDLSEVFVTKDIRDIRYLPIDPEIDPEGELVGGLEGRPEGEHSYKKETKKYKENSHTHTKPMVSLENVSANNIETTATPTPGAGRGSANVAPEALAEPAGLDAEIAGTPAYRLAELYLSLSGRTTGSAQSLQQWARQLQPAVQTFGAEKLTAAITWALKDDAQKWWVGRLRDWDALLRNLATVVAQFDAEELKASRGDSIWQNRQGPVDDSPQTAPAPSQALSDSAAAIAARMYEPIAQEPSSRDVARIAELLGKQPQAEVLETLDWAMKNEFWLSKMSAAMFCRSYTTIRGQFQRSKLTAAVSKSKNDHLAESQKLENDPNFKFAGEVL